MAPHERTHNPSDSSTKLEMYSRIVGFTLLTPQSRLIDRAMFLPTYTDSLTVITMRSFKNYQNATNKYSQRIAQHTWSVLNKCTEGTLDAQRYAKRYLDNGAPDLQGYSLVDPHAQELVGLHADLFPYLVQEVDSNRKSIDRLAGTSIAFLHELAGAAEAELTELERTANQ